VDYGALEGEMEPKESKRKWQKDIKKDTIREQILDEKRLREKLTQALCINSGDIIPNCNECIYFNSVSEHRCDNHKIDQILALLEKELK